VPSSLGCLAYVKENAQRGDPASVVRTIDEFAGKHMMMNVGEDKGGIVDAEIRRKRPAIMAELGSYTGYSTVRFASAQRKAGGEKPSHYYAFEFSPVYASRVREVR
jgi:catechol O-methyltransferase